MSVYVEDWQASYGSPYLVTNDEASGGDGILFEDGDTLVTHPGRAPTAARLAFVDGVRRVEASLYLVDGDGLVARGVAGAHGCGAVLVEPGTSPRFDHVAVSRHVIFGSGQASSLPTASGGWCWQANSIAHRDPDAPLAELQRRMRQAEGVLADRLCAAGWLAVVDGPLTFVRSHDLPVVGYVKTHHRMLREPTQHARVPDLPVATRTSLFAHADRYSAYARIAESDHHAGPWSGVVRLELPQSAGVAASAATADALTALLPRFAGVRHRDPRAPQNLQPVGALEKHMRHQLGSPALAVRAVRDAVAQLAASPASR